MYGHWYHKPLPVLFHGRDLHELRPRMFNLLHELRGNYMEIVTMVKQDMEWSNIKKTPAGSLARLFQGENKGRWEVLGVVQNRICQQLLQ